MYLYIYIVHHKGNSLQTISPALDLTYIGGVPVVMGKGCGNLPKEKLAASAWIWTYNTHILGDTYQLNYWTADWAESYIHVHIKAKQPKHLNNKYMHIYMYTCM